MIITPMHSPSDEEISNRLIMHGVYQYFPDNDERMIITPVHNPLDEEIFDRRGPNTQCLYSRRLLAPDHDGDD